MMLGVAIALLRPNRCVRWSINKPINPLKQKEPQGGITTLRFLMKDVLFLELTRHIAQHLRKDGTPVGPVVLAITHPKLMGDA